MDLGEEVGERRVRAGPLHLSVSGSGLRFGLSVWDFGLEFRFRLSVSGFGFWSGFRDLGFGFCFSVSGFGFLFLVSVSGFVFGFRVWVSGFGFGFGVSNFGFRVQGMVFSDSRPQFPWSRVGLPQAPFYNLKLRAHTISQPIGRARTNLQSKYPS